MSEWASKLTVSESEWMIYITNIEFPQAKTIKKQGTPSSKQWGQTSNYEKGSGRKPVTEIIGNWEIDPSLQSEEVRMKMDGPSSKQ